jgi:hypothetical protein
MKVKSGALVILDFDDIHPRELPIHLIRHKKSKNGVVAEALWKKLLSYEKEEV